MISTMLSGTAGTSLRESRRPPARALRPGGPHPAGSLRIRTLSSVPRLRPGKARPRWPGTSARQRHPPRQGNWPGTPQVQASVMGRPRRTVPEPGPCRPGGGHRDPARQRQDGGHPGGDAASIRAAIAAGPPSPQVARRRSDTDPPAGIRPQPPQPRLQPCRGNAERDDDDNTVRALTTPTRNPNPGARAAGRNAGFLASAPVIGITGRSGRQAPAGPVGGRLALRSPRVAHRARPRDWPRPRM